jgi:hypothetical protein
MNYEVYKNREVHACLSIGSIVWQCGKDNSEHCPLRSPRCEGISNAWRKRLPATAAVALLLLLLLELQGAVDGREVLDVGVADRLLLRASIIP